MYRKGIVQPILNAVTLELVVRCTSMSSLNEAANYFGYTKQSVRYHILRMPRRKGIAIMRLFRQRRIASRRLQNRIIADLHKEVRSYSLTGQVVGLTKSGAQWATYRSPFR